VDKTTAQQPKVQQFETGRRQGLGYKIFLLIFHNLIINKEVPKLKLFSQQEFRGLEDKMTAQVPKVQQFQPTRIRKQQRRHLVTNTTKMFFGGKSFFCHARSNWRFETNRSAV